MKEGHLPGKETCTKNAVIALLLALLVLTNLHALRGNTHTLTPTCDPTKNFTNQTQLAQLQRQLQQALAPREVRRLYPDNPVFDKPIDALRMLRPDRPTSNDQLLLCVGQGKTATKSLNKALYMLGWRTAHFYGGGIYGLLFGNAAEKVNHSFIFPHDKDDQPIQAVLDTPVVDFYNEIFLTYPNAKVILTVRKLKSWLKSQQKFYKNFAGGCRKWLEPWRRGGNLVYGTECPSPEQALKRYVQHNRNVYDNVPSDRLLIMDIPGGDGWEKLCPFLGIPIPPKTDNWTFPSRK